MSTDSVAIDGLMLRTYGDFVIVEANIDGTWVMLIGAQLLGLKKLEQSISTIVGPSLIRRTIAERLGPADS